MYCDKMHNFKINYRTDNMYCNIFSVKVLQKCIAIFFINKTQWKKILILLCSHKNSSIKTTLAYNRISLLNCREILILLFVNMIWYYYLLSWSDVVFVVVVCRDVQWRRRIEGYFSVSEFHWLVTWSLTGKSLPRSKGKLFIFFQWP